MQQTLQNIFNPNEAPEGFYAVLKSSIPEIVGNKCRACDFRSQCDAIKHRCMPHEVVTAKGERYKRNDGFSVVFKRKA